jgi:diaminohydroxyphosphoribosylaminopyrimidine deaminase/5-amino-6-(5-phosphoribosylamino)uracil reductase
MHVFLYFRIRLHPEQYIRRCFELAQLAKGNTAPSPMVGAVLIYNDRIIGEGWHRQYGVAHAEINCLASVKEEDKHLISQSTMYVNLEPCAHHGKTPPCAVRLVEEKVKTVVISNTDPFEKVDGKGIDILNKNKIPVTTGILEKEGSWLNRRFFCFHQKKRPYIILKWAQTKEGFFAPADRSRFQISNEHSQLLAHKWRIEEAAIMVGYNTALYDNPQLTARHWNGKQPLRIVIDRNLQLPKTHYLFKPGSPTWILNEQKEDSTCFPDLIQIPFDEKFFSRLMQRLYNANILSIIVEGGANLLDNFINHGLWDEARIFTGNAHLPNGIAAPLIHNADLAFETQIADDTLRVYTNKGTAYPYVQGMEL